MTLLECVAVAAGLFYTFMVFVTGYLAGAITADRANEHRRWMRGPAPTWVVETHEAGPPSGVGEETK